MAPPNMAGILANLRARFGSIRAKDALRTATALCKKLYPSGHIRRRTVRTAASDLSRPPAVPVL